MARRTDALSVAHRPQYECSHSPHRTSSCAVPRARPSVGAGSSAMRRLRLRGLGVKRRGLRGRCQRRSCQGTTVNDTACQRDSVPKRRHHPKDAPARRARHTICTACFDKFTLIAAMHLQRRGHDKVGSEMARNSCATLSVSLCLSLSLSLCLSLSLSLSLSFSLSLSLSLSLCLSLALTTHAWRGRISLCVLTVIDCLVGRPCTLPSSTPRQHSRLSNACNRRPSLPSALADRHSRLRRQQRWRRCALPPRRYQRGTALKARRPCPVRSRPALNCEATSARALRGSCTTTNTDAAARRRDGGGGGTLTAAPAHQAWRRRGGRARACRTSMAC